MSEPNEDITICNVCNGWGYVKRFRYDKCKTCNGIGVYIKTDKGLLTFGMPTFVNFGVATKRKKLIFLFKGGVIFLVLLMIIFAVLIV